MNARLSLLCVLLAALGATPSLATPSGKKWGMASCSGGGCPMGQQCVSNVCVPQYRVAQSLENLGGMTLNGGLSYATVLNRTTAAFSAWTASRVSCSTSWNIVNVGTFSAPAGRAAINGSDKINNVIWLTSATWSHLPNELALTTTTYFTSNNEIFDADIEFNDGSPTSGVAWSDNLAAGTYDAESVILHEAGHFIGLNHTSSANAVMYAFFNKPESRRVLDALDAADVCTVYPGGTGGQGASCSTNTDCTGGRQCLGRQGSTTKMCTTACTSSTTCPVGYTCQTATTGLACLPQVGAPDQCKFCQSGGECSSSLCLRFDTGVTFCSLSCTENAQCGSGYTCQLPDGYCVPTTNTCTNQCTTATQCATGYTCTGGTCTPRGDTGDPCTVSLFCKSCNVCTRESASSATSYCRACCAGQNQGGFCTACANTACGSGNTCTALSSGSSSVCLPGVNAPTTCEPCNNGMCAEGLVCVAGRCRAACNPASPGTCQACFSLTSGGGACACTDEISTEGEPCGQIGQNTLAACGAGLACVGSTSFTCRSRCDVNVPNSCRTGQSCQLMNGVAVCLPGTEGTACAPCTNTGQCNTGLTCYLGRCYNPCNVNLANACSTCVQSEAGGGGICGCQDQISPENGPCGTQPEVKSCQTGLKCLSGSCRGRCDPGGTIACPIFTECQDLGGGQFYCVDQVATGGGSGATGGGSGTGGGRTGGGGGARPTGGGTGGGGGAMDLGCGCGPGGSPMGALLFGLIAVLRRRKAA